MNSSEEKLRKRLARLAKWVDRAAHTWQKALSETETQYLNVVRDLEEEKQSSTNRLQVQEEQLKGQLDQAGKEYVKNKYQFEKEVGQRKIEIERAQREIEVAKQTLTSELNRINQEKVQNQISFERQKSALQDLYTEKKRHLLVMREKSIREASQAQATYKNYKERYVREMEAIQREYDKKISFLKDQLSSKQGGWDLSLQAMKKELDALTAQKDDIESKLNSIQNDKERELHDIQLQMTVSREQLEIDKVALVEKAEEDQRNIDAEVRDLQDQFATAERNLQGLILDKENEKKTSEDAYLSEENHLKETLRLESEKRDYEQKLLEQEKSGKEKELIRLRADYEKKKTQWDNQIKTLLMQKSLQDAEANAERMRIDREARVVVRSLEAKRDELQQHLRDLESRHSDYATNSGKELELLKQRWQWRKDRLWSMWQGRLDLLKKERTSLMEQLEHLQNTFTQEKEDMAEESAKNEARVDELKEGILKEKTETDGLRKQREIQLELEKTRVIAQIKECESLVIDWMDKQKLSHAEFAKQRGTLVEDLGFLDKYYRAQQDETELFLSAFQNALSIFKGELEKFGISQDAA